MTLRQEIGTHGTNVETLYVRIPTEQRSRLDLLHQRGFNRSQLVRLALRDFFEKLEESGELPKQ